MMDIGFVVAYTDVAVHLLTSGGVWPPAIP